MYSSAATMDGKIHQFHHIQFWVNLCCIFSNIFALVNSDLFIHDSTGRLPLLFKNKKMSMNHLQPMHIYLEWFLIL